MGCGASANNPQKVSDGTSYVKPVHTVPDDTVAKNKVHQVEAPAVFTADDVSNKILAARYEVRGTVPLRANALEAMLKSGEQLPFDRMIKCHIGNPQAVEQRPITFYRQVASVLCSPSLLGQGIFAEDVERRAAEYLSATGNAGIGAYTDSRGLALVRQQVAAFIERRDGFPADPERIYLTSGASEGISRCISMMVCDESVGIMVPCPQYPLYSATLTMTGGRLVSYRTFENDGWRTTQAELEDCLSRAKAEGIRVRSIVVINPGNPVGTVLDTDDIAMFISFAAANKLVILADEVYQSNVYAEGKQFVSFKRVLREQQAEDAERYAESQLVSFHSTSKGLLGECGQRGGYMELVGFNDGVVAVMQKVAATNLSPGTMGQCFVGLMVTPPRPEDPSNELFRSETGDTFLGLQKRAKLISEGLNSIPGISCNPIEGAMYAFPKVQMPEAAVKEAKNRNMEADVFWCLELVEATGVVTVPGSGFGQETGTYHFRTTILPPEEMLQDMVQKVASFHADFVALYGTNLHSRPGSRTQ
eukprot:CAMPEP_0172684788 /NCGR_PEP_ID=MMETSP1074-20121228/19801_1 /TAXON_ID=2916 /ORGANISM="Ceratium fusus, Strain PA161109" /LENGTH=532 /DNA_ID=CAMNT_0013503851 /DNA_START=68 /DNA_END=1666 /DNA_ORIENTATION=+